jgi:hypothetical protein
MNSKCHRRVSQRQSAIFLDTSWHQLVIRGKRNIPCYTATICVLPHFLCNCTNFVPNPAPRLRAPLRPLNVRSAFVSRLIKHPSSLGVSTTPFLPDRFIFLSCVMIWFGRRWANFFQFLLYTKCWLDMQFCCGGMRRCYLTDVKPLA